MTESSIRKCGADSKLFNRCFTLVHSLIFGNRDTIEVLLTDAVVSCRLGVHPALIAAIISRQSQAGTKLSANGFGQFDQNCFGLMQVCVGMLQSCCWGPVLITDF